MDNEAGSIPLDTQWLGSYQQHQLLKVTVPIETGRYAEAVGAIAGLKVAKALRLKLLAFVAAGMYRNDTKAGWNLFDMAVREADTCWLRTDQIEVLGYIITRLATVGQKKWARQLAAEALERAARLNQAATTVTSGKQRNFDTMLNLACSLVQGGLRRQARSGFRLAVTACDRFSSDNAVEYVRKMAAWDRTARIMADAGFFKTALRATDQIRSRVFDGLDYYNNELFKVDTLIYIGVKLAEARKFRRAGRVLIKAARVVLEDVHDDDRLREERFGEIAAMAEACGASRKAGRVVEMARRISESAG